MKVHRRRFLAQTLAAGASVAFVERRTAACEPAEIRWHDVESWGVEGKGWRETVRYFDRLPAKAEGMVRGPVWSLSRHAAGMLVRFATNATQIQVRYRLLSPNLAMPHMPATGVSGIDLYAQDDAGRWRWVSVTRPVRQEMDGPLASGLAPTKNGSPRQFIAYLPLYNGVDSLQLGVAAKSEFRPVAPRQDPPLVFYGTSIMHGACASRPGMSITALVGRRTDVPVINLGFSGNGRLESEVAELMAELEARVYILDCLPNLSPPQVAERTVPFVNRLRKARPETPILMVEDRSYGDAWIRRERGERNRLNRIQFRKAYESLRAAGVGKLSYLPGERLLGNDNEATTDGSHPNDLGMMRYADAYVKALRPLL